MSDASSENKGRFKVKPVHFLLIGAMFGGILVGLCVACSFDLQPAGITYPDLIAVLLTGVSILLAVVGLGLAALALMGWTTFKGMTEKAAGNAALAHIKADGAGRIDTVIEAKVIAFITEGYADGSLPALATQRASELQAARELDRLDEMDQWRNAPPPPPPPPPARAAAPRAPRKRK